MMNAETNIPHQLEAPKKLEGLKGLELESILPTYNRIEPKRKYTSDSNKT
jgi:hypothetical protein